MKKLAFFILLSLVTLGVSAQSNLKCVPCKFTHLIFM